MARKRKEKRYRLRTQWSNLYIAITMIFFLSFGFFLSSKIFLAEEFDVLNTEIGKEFNLNSKGKFTINDWIYDENSNQMQVTLVTSDMRNYLTELDFKAVARSNLNKQLQTKVVYSSNDIYIININDVPKNFHQVSLRLLKNDVSITEDFKEVEQKSEKDNLITRVYADETLVKRAEISDGDVRDYAIDVTEKMIKETDKNIGNLEKEIKNKEKLTEKIEVEITKIKSEMLYQTLEEQTESNNNIYTLEKDITEIKREIETLNTDILSYKNKAKRLDQRITDLKF